MKNAEKQKKNINLDFFFFMLSYSQTTDGGGKTEQGAIIAARATILHRDLAPVQVNSKKDGDFH